LAGQSVGMVNKEEPVADIIATLLAECEAALARR
jgi:enoyl-[acyl-carrier protein] reductase II